MQTFLETDERVENRGSISPSNFGSFLGGKNKYIMLERFLFLLLQILQYTVNKLNQIQEEHYIKAHSSEERMIFYSATTARNSYKAQSNEGSKQSQSTRPTC